MNEDDAVTTEENKTEKTDAFTGNVEDEVVSIRTLYNAITAAASGGDYEKLETSDGVIVYKDENHVKEIAVSAGTDESSYEDFIITMMISLFLHIMRELQLTGSISMMDN